MFIGEFVAATFLILSLTIRPKTLFDCFILGISPSVIYGNKIPKSFFVTCGVTHDNWTVTSYVVVMVLVRVYMYDALNKDIEGQSSL